MRRRRTLGYLANDPLAKTHLKGGSVIDDSRLKMVLILATSAAYILAFKPVHLVGGDAVGSLVIFPVALAGWLLGTRMGMIAGILSIPLNGLLYGMVITPALPELIDAWPAHIAVIIVGAVSGWTRELLDRVELQSLELTGEREALKDQILERKRAEDELRERDRLLMASAQAAKTLLVEGDTSAAINKTLALLGEVVEADRAYIFENHCEDGEILMSQLYEWKKDGIEPQIDNPALQKMPYHPDYARLYEILCEGETYRGLVRDFPACERTLLESQGIISILIVPITMQDLLWGFVGFDDCHSERVWVEGEISVLQVAASSIGGFITRTRTNDDLIQARDELEMRIEEVKSRKSELEAKNGEMERFVYTVSHDLRSPLVTVQGFVGFLREDVLDGDHERIETDLLMIEDAVFKMDHLLRDTLELSRIGRVVNPPEDVSFGEIVLEALAQVSDEMRSIGPKFVVAEDWPRVRVDRLRILEVLTNLIENSTKYMGDGIRPEIEIGWLRDGGETIFFVKDNGIGIEADQKEKVFGLFYKLDPSTQGSGAGLAIVKRIVEVHGGRIWIESEKGKGTTVFFTIPTAEA